MRMEQNKVEERSREIGQLLREARTTLQQSISQCAQVIGTSRKRYRAIEAGSSVITFVELEVLLNYLHVPREQVWAEPTASTDRVVRLQAVPGQTLHLVVEVTHSPSAGLD